MPDSFLEHGVWLCLTCGRPQPCGATHPRIFAYRDGIGAQRCNRCLALWNACHCERMFSMRFFDEDKVGCYLDDIGHRVEKTKDGKETPMVDLTLRVQPFTVELAAALDADVRALLFTMNEALPKAKLKAIHFRLPVPKQALGVYLLKDVDDGGILLADVEITDPRARVEKGVDGYGFVFYASFGPVSKDELLYLVGWQTQQRFVTFHPHEPALNFKAAEEAGAPPPPRRPRAVGTEAHH
jgi:hypothetical protein